MPIDPVSTVAGAAIGAVGGDLYGKAKDAIDTGPGDDLHLKHLHDLLLMVEEFRDRLRAQDRAEHQAYVRQITVPATVSVRLGVALEGRKSFLLYNNDTTNALYLDVNPIQTGGLQAFIIPAGGTFTDSDTAAEWYALAANAPIDCRIVVVK